jgi:hypothetical protein
VVLGFKLRALCLLGRQSATWATPPAPRGCFKICRIRQPIWKSSLLTQREKPAHFLFTYTDAWSESKQWKAPSEQTQMKGVAVLWLYEATVAWQKLCLIWGTSKLFPSISHSYKKCSRVSTFLHPCQHLSVFLILASLIEIKWYLFVCVCVYGAGVWTHASHLLGTCSHLYFPVSFPIECHFVGLLDIHMFSWEISLQIICPLFNWFACLFIKLEELKKQNKTSWKSFLCFLNMSPLSDDLQVAPCLWVVLSLSWWCPFKHECLHVWWSPIFLQCFFWCHI